MSFRAKIGMVAFAALISTGTAAGMAQETHATNTQTANDKAGTSLAGISHPMADALQPFINQHLISGAVVVVATKDKIIDEESVGFADIESQRMMTTSTLFAIASMTKPMTITALMMLVEEGKVKIDDPVEKYLPEFKGQMYIAEQDDNHMLLKKPGHPMLVRELMCHISGMAKSYPMGLPKHDDLPLATLVRTYALSPLEADPGTHYNYSDPGINTAGLIIEVASGKPYEQFMQDRLFTPLGMKDTTFIPNREQIARLASLYEAKSDASGLERVPLAVFTYPLDNSNRYPFPAGGLFSTAEDVAKFCQMILSGGAYDGKRYLQKSTVDMMTRKQTPDGVGVGRAYPWALNLGKNGEAFGHGGAFRTYMVIDPKVNLIGILMLHHVGGWSTPDEKKVYPAFIQTVYDVAGVPASVELSPEP